MNRKESIEHIIKDLSMLKESDSFENQYAIEANIKFFKSIQSVWSYAWWLMTEAPKLDKRNLLELTDLPFSMWDREMHAKLVEIEKREFPGLIEPLVNKIANFISKENRPLILISLGCGGMETELQVIKKMLDLRHNQKIIFIGVDKSPITHRVAKENLREIESRIGIHEIENLDARALNAIIHSEKNTYVVIICKNDIFRLNSFFSKNNFDLSYHSFFKHHLSSDQQIRLMEVVRSISKRTFEYDGYRSWIHLIPQTITAWKYPPLLNGSIFSNFRYPRKRELKELEASEKINSLHIYKIRTYLMEL